MKLLNRPNLSGAALGAALGAAVVVSVYEGRVLLAKGGDRWRWAPATRRADRQRRPERRVLRRDTPEAKGRGRGGRPSVPRFEEAQALRARIVEQDKELAELRAGRPRGQEGGREEGTYPRRQPGGAAGPGRALRGGVRHAFHQRLRREGGPVDGPCRGRARSHERGHEGGEGAGLRRDAGALSRDERRQRHRGSSVPPAMESEIFERAPEGSRRRPASSSPGRGRAWSQPPADLAKTPVAERTMRLKMTIGDRSSRRWPGASAPQRARALRAQHDGWRGKTVTNGCE